MKSPSGIRSALVKIRKLQKRGKKIVFTNGCFDLIHSGHVRLLNQAKKLGDVLVVGLNTDASVRWLKGASRPILTLKERREVLSNLRCVDFVLPFGEKTPYDLIRLVQPDVLIKGGDWGTGSVVGRDIVEQRGGKLVKGLFVKGRSTSEIIERIRCAEPGTGIRK